MNTSKDKKSDRILGFRKAWEFIKNRWIFVLLITWGITTIYLVCQRWNQLGELISAIGVETLVFVTWFYAVQTKKLVEEEQKKRKADFWEKRILDFYMPFNDTLNKIDESLSMFAPPDVLINLHNSLVKLFWGKQYMVSDKTAEKIRTIFPYILGAKDDSWEGRMSQEYRRIKGTLKKLITGEWKIIEDQIREFYGIEEKEDENPQGE